MFPICPLLPSMNVEILCNSSRNRLQISYGFDELPADVIVATIEYAFEVGTSMFFDPGPRGRSLALGTHEEQEALAKLLKMSDVLLLTSDEAESLSGLKNPIAAGQELLTKGVRTKWVVVKSGSKGSVLITESSISCVPSFKVNVINTVGYGGSYVAAVALGYIHNMPVINTLTLANAVCAAITIGCGAGRNVADFGKVVELMRESNLIEGNESCNELLKEHLDAEEVTILSNMTGEIRATLEKVVSEILPKFKVRLEDGMSSF